MFSRAFYDFGYILTKYQNSSNMSHPSRIIGNGMLWHTIVYLALFGSQIDGGTAKTRPEADSYLSQEAVIWTTAWYLKPVRMPNPIHRDKTRREDS